MKKETPRSIPERLHKERIRLPHFVEEAESAGPAMVWLTIIVILLPYIVFLTMEIGARIIDPPILPLRPPWAPELRSPYPPLTRYAWTGDLKRIARLPYYDKLIEQSPFLPRYTLRITDEWGFVNKPTGQPPRPIDEQHDIILTGASYMAEGSTIEHTFASQLTKELGKSVYNASWPSGGPVTGMIHLLTNPQFFTGKADLIILGIIQRYLYGYNFNEAFEHIAEDGSILPSTIPQHPNRQSLRDYPDWRNTLETYLESTSSIRAWALKAGQFLPPMAFDRGINTDIRISWLKDIPHAPILFYPADIASTFHSYESREGDKILEALIRIHQRCQTLGTKLLIVIVPDKYEVYRDHLNPPLLPQRNPLLHERPTHPRRRAPQVLVERLQEQGIDAIDLFPTLYDAQFHPGETKLLYWVDDTHWSDAGIAVAAKTVGNQIQTLYLQ
ncbi:MAG: hypothetical protein C4527_12420 [Candidatus Omnitrophota bacterium]|jgi:hypothetical protein|nr:MAG: hypothetical protein C4527_12420 [Candidatus Omnitrophota bacterium]